MYERDAEFLDEQLKTAQHKATVRASRIRRTINNRLLLMMDRTTGNVQYGHACFLLTPTPFTVLEHLAMHYGEVCNPDSFMARCWPGVIVEDNQINFQISFLRKTFRSLGQDDAIIITYPKRGSLLDCSKNEVLIYGSYPDH